MTCSRFFRSFHRSVEKLIPLTVTGSAAAVDRHGRATGSMIFALLLSGTHVLVVLSSSFTAFFKIYVCL